MSLAKPSERESPVAAGRPTTPRSPLVWLWLLAALLAAVLWYWLAHRGAEREATAQAARAAARSVSVAAIAARLGEMPVVLSGLGSVTGFNTVTVKSRVDGQLVAVKFQEGQLVREGELLAEIDARPFEAQSSQAEGQLARDVAELKDAEINFERFKDLLARQFISKQQYDSQAMTVAQLEGSVKADRGAIANAKLQLTYSRITAPIGGRVGLRLVDAGNMVHAADQQGLVVITQVQPIAVLFTIPEDNLPPVMQKLRSGARLAVDAYDRAGRTLLATGDLVTADNQIDAATGTFKLKAVFPNQDHALFPNQFVNVRLLLDRLEGKTIVPASAVQRGPQGAFVYVVKADQTAEVRAVTVGATGGGEAAIDAGLAPGELAIVDGVDKLRAGSRVEVQKPPTVVAAPGA